MFLKGQFFLSTQVVGKAIWGAQNACNCLGCGEGCKKSKYYIYFHHYKCGSLLPVVVDVTVVVIQ